MSKLSYPPPRLQGPMPALDKKLEMEEDPIDTGVIRCICSSSDDDGFTIQCEQCLVWQHAFCVRIDQSNIPDHYLCDKCERKSKDDRRSEFTRQRKDIPREDLMTDGLSLAEKKRAFTLVEPIPIETPATKRKEEKQKGRMPFTRIKRPTHDNARRPSLTPRTTKKPKLSKRIAITQDTLRGLDSSEPLAQSLQKKLPHKRGYVPTNYNTVKSKFVKQIFKEARERWSQQNKWRPAVWKDGLPRREEHTRTRDCPYVSMDTVTIISNNTKIFIRPLKRSDSTLYPRNDLHLRKGVFSDTHIPSDWFLMEVNGDVFLKSEYKFNPINEFSELGTQREHVLFFPTLDLCIDARYHGNNGRYIRRSCHPNADVRSIILPHSKDDNTIHLGIFTREEIRPGQEVTLGWNWQRGHIAWQKNVEWHNRTPGTDDQHQVIDEEEEREKRKAVQRMLDFFYKEFGDCGCQDRGRCFIEYLRKEASGEKNRKTWTAERPVVPRRVNDEDDPLDIYSPKRKQEKTTRTNIDNIFSLPNSRQIVVSASNPKLDGQDRLASDSPDVSIEECLEIDVTSTSPGLGSPVQSEMALRVDGMSEEELDVDGDIDIGEDFLGSPLNRAKEQDGMSAVRDMSDNEDLSSLTSLSSLSGFEDTGNEASDDERRVKTKGRRLSRRKEEGRQGGRSRRRHDNGFRRSPETEKSGEVQGGKVHPNMLPFKKRWMCSFREKGSKSDKDDMSRAEDEEEKISLGNLESIQVSSKRSVHESDMEVEPSEEAHITPEPEYHKKTVDIQESFSKDITDIPHTLESTVIDQIQSPRQRSNSPSVKRHLVHLDTQVSEYTSEVILDDGELSDASSASTLPLDEDDRKPTPTITSALSPTIVTNQPIPSEETPVDTGISDNLDSTPSRPPILDPTDKVAKHDPVESTLPLDIPSVKNTKDTTLEENVKKESPPDPEKKQEPSKAMIGNEGQGNLEPEVKPVKIKLSIQEYLSRRSAHPSEQSTDTIHPEEGPETSTIERLVPPLTATETPPPTTAPTTAPTAPTTAPTAPTTAPTAPTTAVATTTAADS
ncbi:hypothetical protein CLU79DRAFT_830911 [Phycomyces nitens]|nr:hypothetical protein CLU79DRAFT_830911 [Phycomyces nitens]